MDNLKAIELSDELIAYTELIGSKNKHIQQVAKSLGEHIREQAESQFYLRWTDDGIVTNNFGTIIVTTMLNENK